MGFFFPRKHGPKYFFANLATVVGIVLVWRGLWYMLDSLDKALFGGSPFWTALLGVIVGLLILYVPDKNLKEIEKL